MNRIIKRESIFKLNKNQERFASLICLELYIVNFLSNMLLMCMSSYLYSG